MGDGVKEGDVQCDHVCDPDGDHDGEGDGEWGRRDGDALVVRALLLLCQAVCFVLAVEKEERERVKTHKGRKHKGK